MSLGSYPQEISAIADELSDLLLSDYAAATSLHSWQSIAHMSEPDIDRAVKLLGQSPSQRTRSLRSMSDSDASLLILRARFLGLQAAQASHFADRFEMMPGKSYRNAAVFAALEVSRCRFTPTYDETVPYALQRRVIEPEFVKVGKWTFDDD